MNPAPLARRVPARLWMTGSVAVAMVALMHGRVAGNEERPRSAKVSRSSPYSIEETLKRIEAAARGDGLTVLMRIDGAQTAIVLGSSVGGTPVMQDGDAPPDMPLAVQVQADARGGTEVLITASARTALGDWAELPAAVADDVARLPGMLDRALLRGDLA